MRQPLYRPGQSRFVQPWRSRHDPSRIGRRRVDEHANPAWPSILLRAGTSPGSSAQQATFNLTPDHYPIHHSSRAASGGLVLQEQHSPPPNLTHPRTNHPMSISLSGSSCVMTMPMERSGGLLEETIYIYTYSIARLYQKCTLPRAGIGHPSG